MYMLENLETLLEIQKQGSMARASTRLRVSQSAVSKRIQALETYYETKLIEKSGRNVILTEAGEALVERISPLLSELREVLFEKRNQTKKKKVVIGVAESILSSWGALRLKKVFDSLDIEVEYHSHRSPVIIDKVEMGVYDLGICGGDASKSRAYLTESLDKEELVLVANQKEALKNVSEVISIEKSSATWKAIRKEVNKQELHLKVELESFFSAAQLAKAAYGVALVPLGVAETLAFEKNCIKSLRPKMYRPIQLIYKKSKLERDYFQALIRALKKI